MSAAPTGTEFSPLPISMTAGEPFPLPTQQKPIATLEPGTKIESCYLMQNFQIRPKKDGSNFVTMLLRDATGKVTAVMWEGFDALTGGLIHDNDFVEVVADVLLFNGQLQLKVNRVRKVADDQVDPSLFLPVSPLKQEELEVEFDRIVGLIDDPDFRALIDAVFGAPGMRERFFRAPSAVSMHHAYLRGLAEHTVSVVRNALNMASNYPGANRQLLITAGLLHDIGKVMEFNYDRKIAYTDVGRLLGHISMGNSFVELHCSRIAGFPASKKALLQHAILSHHGVLEFGSPKRPKTVDAVILHHADLLDAEMSNIREATDASNGRWEFSNMFDRFVLLRPDNEIENADLLRQLVGLDFEQEHGDEAQ